MAQCPMPNAQCAQCPKVSEEDMTEDERKEWRRMHPDGVDWSAFNDWQNPKGGEDVLPEWQRLHKELMKTDISG